MAVILEYQMQYVIGMRVAYLLQWYIRLLHQNQKLFSPIQGKTLLNVFNLKIHLLIMEEKN